MPHHLMPHLSGRNGEGWTQVVRHSGPTFAKSPRPIKRIHDIFTGLVIFFISTQYVRLLGVYPAMAQQGSHCSAQQGSPSVLCTYALVRERELRRYLGILVSYWLAQQEIGFLANRRQARLVSYWSRNEIPVEPANRKPGFLSFVGL